MRESQKLGRLRGISVFLHWPFVIVPAWVALALLAAGATLASAASATFFLNLQPAFVIANRHAAP